jgi:hypothetical protein
MRVWRLALPVVVALVYAPSLAGGFLNYDDDWVIGRNTVVTAPLAEAMPRIWTDLSPETRHTLTDEYLPMRDSSLWFDVRILGGSAAVLRAMNLAIYLAALLLLRGALRRVFTGEGAVAELGLWLFALHPTHAESVAWIAGRKDVLALLFVAAALFVHTRDRRHGIVTVPLLLVLATTSKSMAIVGPLLLPLSDLARRRPIAWRTMLASLVAVAPVFLVQLHLGRTMQHVHAPLGGDRLTAAASMGPVFARYVAHSFLPFGLSITYDMHVWPAGSLRAWLGYLPLIAWLVPGVWAWRKRDLRAPLLTALWFIVSLAPVSQVLVPIDNVEADRYLLLPVLGPCLLLALGASWLARREAARSPLPGALARAPEALAAPVVVFFALLTVGRGLLFSDSVLLWQDALAKTETHALPPYQLGVALDAAGRRAEAHAAFLKAARRAPTSSAESTRYISGLLIARGEPDAAAILLRKGVRSFPGDPQLLGNLAVLLADSPDPATKAEGRELFDTLLRQFPNDELGRRNYVTRYGQAP